MAMQVARLFQGTLEEKSRQQDGNGSSNTGSLTPTGNLMSGTLRPTTGSSSPSANQPGFQLDVISELMQMRAEEEFPDREDNLGNGGYTGIAGSTWSRLEEDYLERLF